MAETDKKKDSRWYYKLRDKYRLVILNDETYEERFSFRLSRLNVFISVGTTAIILIIFTTFLIAFTPLREYVPGYTDVTLSKRVDELLRKTDSLENAANQRTAYLENIRRIINGEEIQRDTINLKETSSDINYKNINYTRSIEDSLLREEYDKESSYDIYYDGDQEAFGSSPASFAGINFFNPLEGFITSEFDLSLKHYGIDIVSKKNEAVKATLGGTVIFAGWSVEGGYTISVQHKGDFISVYKHNSVLLKEQGSTVKAGDPIAIVGESGELTTGAHLHFELWYNGTPVNPREYIAF